MKSKAHKRVMPRDLRSSDASMEKSVISSQIHMDDSLATVSSGEEVERDYLQKVLQFGTISLFSSIFPFAPIIALLNNTFEVHSDAWKYLFLYSRFPPTQVGLTDKLLIHRHKTLEAGMDC